MCTHVAIDTVFVFCGEGGLFLVGTDGDCAAEGFLEVGEDGRFCCAVETADFSRGADVVLLETSADEAKWDDEDQEDGAGCRTISINSPFVSCYRHLLQQIRANVKTT